jgi:hypothetical protein
MFEIKVVELNETYEYIFWTMNNFWENLFVHFKLCVEFILDW